MQLGRTVALAPNTQGPNARLAFDSACEFTTGFEAAQSNSTSPHTWILGTSRTSKPTRLHPLAPCCQTPSHDHLPALDTSDELRLRHIQKVQLHLRGEHACQSIVLHLWSRTMLATWLLVA